MSSKGQSYTIGHNYKCGLCKQVSRHYKEEKGMLLWCRLHFKKNPACKAHHHAHGLGDTTNNTFVDAWGKSHLVRSGRTGEMTAYAIQGNIKLVGHGKKHKKERLKDAECSNKYSLAAMENIAFKNQIKGDLYSFKMDGTMMASEISHPSQSVKTKKKKKKNKKKKKTKKNRDFKNVVEEQEKRNIKLVIGETIVVDNLISQLPTEYA